MEAEFKLSVENQWSLNTTVCAEVLKLIDAQIIYSIIDSD